MIDTEILQQCKDYIVENGLGSFFAHQMKKTKTGTDLFSKMKGNGISAESVVIELDTHDKWLTECRQRLTDEWRLISNEHGGIAFTQSWIIDNKYTSYYDRSKSFKLTLTDINDAIGKKPVQLARYIPPKKYTKESFDKIVREIIEDFRCIPSLNFLRVTGYNVINNHLKEFYENLHVMRKAFGVDNIKLQAKNGWYLRSIAECCFVNYLLAHGIEPTRGGPYPKEFFAIYKRKGVYDPGFYDQHGNEIKCEIFGGGRMHQEDYNKIRKMKVDFHEGNSNFLAIEFQDCYKDDNLRNILERFIGRPRRIIQDVRFPDLPATMLSVVEDTLKRCQDICDKMLDGELPSNHWFHRTNSFKNRTRYAWEPATWNGLVENISKMGWQAVRKQMIKTPAQQEYIKKQGENTKEQVLGECQAIFDEFQRGPNYVSHLAIFDGRNRQFCTEQQKETRRKARTAAAHFQKLFNGGDDLIIKMLGVEDQALPARRPFDIIKKEAKATDVT